MDEYQWRAIWIDALVQGGADLESAMDAFEIIYGEDELDLSIDPVQSAKALLAETKQK